ncbi:hypothetical protein BH23VER1_BH23VER1_08310 [soil metagenome]
MITTVTGKNQITIPAQIANEIGLKKGSRIEWRRGSQPDELRCIVLPDPAALAASLRGAGRRFLSANQDPVAELIAERAADESSDDEALK